MYCDEFGQGAGTPHFPVPESFGISVSVLRISNGSESRRCCNWTASDLPDAVEPLRRVLGRLQDSAIRPDALGQTEGCRGHAWPTLRSEDKIRNNVLLRNR